VARKIQERVRKETGIYLTVGIGDSPVLAKIALDIEAKHAPNLMAFGITQMPLKNCGQSRN
jgi:DNA polymerase V